MSFIHSPVFNKVVVPISFFSSVVGGIFLLREYRGGKQCPNKDRMDGKVVVITGGSSGIGKATAKELAKRGATVVLGCRHMEKCEKAAIDIRQFSNNRHVVCRFLNLANFDSITNFASMLHNELSHIDVLINNAGVMKPRPPKTTPKTDDGFERQFGVNYLGHYLLTNLLIDMVTNGDSPGRVLNVTAGSYERGKIDLEDLDKLSLEGDEQLSQLYYQSKLANMYFTDSLNRLALSKHDGKFTANCLSPGIVNTNIGRYAETPLISPIWVFEPVKMLMLKTPIQGAQTSIHLASDPTKTETSGRYFDDCEDILKTCEICDQALADKLWELSEDWTNLNGRLETIQHREDNSSDNLIEEKS